MRSAKLLFLLVFLPVLALALASRRAEAVEYPPDVAWAEQYGGSAVDGANALCPAADGSGFVLAGYTWSAASHGGSDVYLVKTDAQGNSLWERAIGGSGDEAAYDLQPAGEDGYILCGYTTSYSSGDRDAYLVKTDAAGNAAWHATFGDYGQEEAYAVRPTTDGGFVAAGYTTSYSSDGDSDAMLLKTDSAGSLAWLRTYGTTGDEAARDVRPTADGGFILVGSTAAVPGLSQVYLVKTNATGVSEWRRTFAGNGIASGAKVRATADGGFIVLGSTQSSATYQTGIYLLKTDATGTKSWDRYFSGTGSDVIQTADGGYVVTGALGYDAYLFKTDGSGTKVWSKTFRADAFSAFSAAVLATADQGFLVAGYADPSGADTRNACLVKLLPGAANRLAPPARVVATDARFADRVTVNWSASPGATHYQLSRSETFAGDKTPITSWQAARTANDTSVTTNVVYYYWVQAAVNADGKRASDYSLWETGWAAPPDEPICRIVYAGCGVTINPTGTVSVGDTQPTASIKIQRLKTRPANLKEVYGIHYISAASFIGIDVAGTLAKFYTDTPVDRLAATGALRSVTARGCTIADAEAAAFATVSMSDTPNSTDATSPTLRLARIVANGQSVPPGYAQAKANLVGVCLDSLDLPQQSAAVRVSTKRVASPVLGAYASVADLGNVTAGASLTATVTGGDVTGRIAAAGVVKSLAARSLAFDASTVLGGHIGAPAAFPATVADRPILPEAYAVWIGAGNPAWRAAHPLGIHARAPAYIGKVSAARGILAVFRSSVTADGSPAYIGAIGSITTPAPSATTGALGLWGIADVHAGAVPLRLVGDTAAAAQSRLLINTAP